MARRADVAPPRHLSKCHEGKFIWESRLARQGSPVAKRCANKAISTTTETISLQDIARTRQHVSVPLSAAVKAAARARGAAGQSGPGSLAGASGGSTRHREAEATEAASEARSASESARATSVVRGQKRSSEAGIAGGWRTTGGKASEEPRPG